MNRSTPGLTVHHQLPESNQTHVHWVGDAIQPFHPLSSPSPPASNPSQHQGLFQWVSSSHQQLCIPSIGVSASTSVLPMNTQDWSPLGWTGWISLQSKGLSSILQHHSSKALILQHSAFFTVQLSHPYMTTGKTTALTRRTFVDKVMSLLSNMLSRLVVKSVVSAKWDDQVTDRDAERKKISSDCNQKSIMDQGQGSEGQEWFFLKGWLGMKNVYSCHRASYESRSGEKEKQWMRRGPDSLECHAGERGRLG